MVPDWSIGWTKTVVKGRLYFLAHHCFLVEYGTRRADYVIVAGMFLVVEDFSSRTLLALTGFQIENEALLGALAA